MLPTASGGHGNIAGTEKNAAEGGGGGVTRKCGSTCVCPGSVCVHVVAQVYAHCLYTCLRTCPHACRCRSPRAPRTCPHTCRSRSGKVSAPSAFAAGALAEKKRNSPSRRFSSQHCAQRPSASSFHRCRACRQRTPIGPVPIQKQKTA